MNNLEKLLEIEFNNKELLKTAMTHSSYANEHNVTNNERLEFLGDAVIELLMSQYLYRNFDMTEGKMTKKRAQSVCEEALVQYAQEIDLPKYLLLGHGEEQSEGRKRKAIIADAFEALFGAIYLDQGFEKSLEVFNKIVVPYIDLTEIIKDYKSTLQECVQSFKKSLSYSVLSEEGPAHNKKFVVAVSMEDVVLGKGSGKTKKEAEQMAAKKALEKGVFEQNETY